MSSNNSVIPPLGTRFLGINYTFQSKAVDPIAAKLSSETTFSVNGVTVADILAAVTSKVEYLGSFIAHYPRVPASPSQPEPLVLTQYALLFTNLGCVDIDLSGDIARLQALKWIDQDNNALTATAVVDEKYPLGQDQLLQLLKFRQLLPDCSYLQKKTLWVLNEQYGKGDGNINELLSDTQATDQGDQTGADNGDGQEGAWAKGLISRITTGGPNGSMAGQIAVNFMSNVDVPAVALKWSKQLDAFAANDTTNPIVALVENAVSTASQSTSEVLADYLQTVIQPSTANEKDRQIATIVKGINDSMNATGKTVAQLAVFNALGSSLIQQLPQAQQLRVAYVVANATRAAVDATGSHIADLYQTDSIPNDEELAAVGARGFKSFLKSVGKTVAKGALQVAPVILNTVVNSANANRSLGSTLPPHVTLSCDGLQELDVPTKITLASRIVNGIYNPEATVVTNRAVSDLADTSCNLSAQATLDTFANTPALEEADDDPVLRDKFRQVALAVANLCPTFANVTDIGATNLVTDTSLQHSDSLRQNALEVGIRSCANMIAENPSAEILYKVHLHRLKTGRDVTPRGFASFLKTAVPIASKIAKTALPSVLSVL